MLCAPHGSALEHFAIAAEKLTASVTLGHASLHATLPCWPIRCYPVGLVDESERAGRPKFRLTSDLSWPHAGALPDGSGGFVDSVNAAMRRYEWPTNRLPRASELAEAAAVLQSSGEACKAWGFDCKAYYRRHGRQLSQLWRNAVAALDGFIVDERCCFGSAADAVKCSRLSNFIAWRVRRALRAVDQRYPPQSASVLSWLAERHAAAVAAGVSDEDELDCFMSLSSFGIYIDDAAATSIDDAIFDGDGVPLVRDGVHLHRAQLHWEAALAELAALGYESEPSKEQPPGDRLEVLGVGINLETRRLTLLPPKRKAYAERASAMAARDVCSKAEVLALLGRLSFASCCFPRGRSWLNAAWRSLRATYRLSSAEGLIKLSPAAREGFARWAAELKSEQHDGVPLASRAMGAVGDAGVGVIYADASDVGFAAWTVHERELVYVVGEWSAVVRDTVPIHGKELQASTLGLIALAPECGWRDVYSFTDNIVAQYAMRDGTSRSHEMQPLIARRSSWMLQHGILEASERITSKANLWADLGSREQISEVVRQAAALGFSERRLPLPAGWMEAFEADWKSRPADA